MRNTTVASSLFGLTLLMALVACKPSVPRGVISRGKMEKILYDYHIAQSLAEQGDSMEQRRYAYVMSVFAKHGITEAEFDSSMVWYSAHSYELRNIYARLAERFEADIAAVGALHDDLGGMVAGGDTAQLWPGGMLYYLQPTHTARMVHVTVPADSCSRAGDEYLWRFDAAFINRDSRRTAAATLVLRHEGDSVTTTSRTFSFDGRVELRLRQEADLALQQADCYIYIPAQDDDTKVASLVITSPVLVRFHRNNTLK